MDFPINNNRKIELMAGISYPASEYEEVFVHCYNCARLGYTLRYTIESIELEGGVTDDIHTCMLVGYVDGQDEYTDGMGTISH